MKDGRASTAVSKLSRVMTVEGPYLTAQVRLVQETLQFSSNNTSYKLDSSWRLEVSIEEYEGCARLVDSADVGTLSFF
jgi:hypothetical protein